MPMGDGGNILHMVSYELCVLKDDLDKIRDKFYKIDKSRTRSGSGTGLGLSIIKNILNLHNTKYGVQNTETGVKFRFEL